MSEKDSRIRFAVAATTTNTDRARPYLLAGAGLLALLVVAWLLFGGGGDAKVGAAKGLDQIQRESYERRIATLKKEVDELAAENEKLKSALLKAQSDLVDFRQRLRQESGRSGQ